MHLIRLIPDDTAIPFVRYQWIAMIVSGLLALASIGMIATGGLNFGIDFKGGILIEIRAPERADIPELREELNALPLGEVGLQRFGEPTDVLIRVQRQEGGEEAQASAVDLVESRLTEVVGEGIQFRRTEFVGPQVSAELLRSGIYAVVLAIAAILVYIWFRFEWQFGIGAIVALVHDVLLTLGVFAFTGFEFNLSTVAAILTIVGYSLNDTVVIYDRVRENLRRYKRLGMAALIDRSLNETLTRTLVTSLTTLIALLALFIFGGPVIRGFTFAMIFGVLVGTYSTVYIASPVLLHLNLRRSVEQEAQPAQPAS